MTPRAQICQPNVNRLSSNTGLQSFRSLRTQSRQLYLNVMTTYLACASIIIRKGFSELDGIVFGRSLSKRESSIQNSG